MIAVAVLSPCCRGLSSTVFLTFTLFAFITLKMWLCELRIMV